jgi:hypothetical protein
MTAPVPTPPANAGDPPKPTPPVTAPALGTQPQLPEPKTEPANDKADEPLGEGGIKALKALREENKTLAAELKAFAPLKELAEKFGAVPAAKPEDDVTAQLAAIKAELQSERDIRLRLEIASEKKLTPAQAARLHGSTRDELLADADALLSLFPAAPATGTSTGQPADFGGGHRGTDVAPADIHAQIAAAEQSGDFRASIRLKSQLLQQQQK